MKKQKRTIEDFFYKNGYAIVIFISLIISQSSFAQVEIKERLEINPEKPLIKYANVLKDTTGGRQGVIVPGIRRDNAQSTFLMPENGKIRVEVIFSEAAASSRISLEIRQPQNIMLCEYANNNVGFTWTSEPYDQNTPVEFGIDWYWNNWGHIYQGKEAGAIVTQISNYEYTMGFEALGDDWDYNELVIDVQIIPSELVVWISPPEIFAGDTANIIIKKRLSDGTLIDYPPEQTFEIGMLDGCILGNIHVDGIDTNYINGAHQPIYFIADTTFHDSGAVSLRVGLVEESTFVPRDVQSDDIGEYCFSENYVTNEYVNTDVVVDNQLVILYPKNDSPDEKITPQPLMPEVTCKAFLKNHSGPVTLDWEYKVSYTYKRWNKSKDICSRISNSTFRGKTTHLGGFNYEWNVSFTADENSSFEFIGQNLENGCESVITEWTEGEVFTGGKVTLTVTAKAFGSELVIAKKTQEANKILGQNPELQDIFNYANSNKIRAIMEEESKQFHFTDDGIDPYYWRPYNEKGWPIYGYPNGYGLMQIDNMPIPPYYATEKIMWNWKSNIDAGKIRIALAEDESNQYIIKRGATVNDKYKLTNAFQNYRWGGFDKFPYVWVNGKWREVNNVDSYGKNVYARYLSLGGGN